MSSALPTIEPQVLTICVYTEFAPFAYERDGAIVGTDIALLRRFARQAGLRDRTCRHPFRDLWQRPGLGECDVAAAGLAALPERDPTANGAWSAPYARVRRALLIRGANAERLRAPADFRGKTIVATPHSTAEIDARRRYQPWGAQIIAAVPSQHAVVEALVRGDIDAFAEGEPSSRYLAGRYGAGRAIVPLALADIHEMDQPETLHFAVRAVDGRLLARLNAFLATLAGADTPWQGREELAGR
jgi:ABC-type amino acid transport substrate-binding protein